MEMIDKQVMSCPYPPMLWEYTCDATDAEHALYMIAGLGIDMRSIVCPCKMPLRPRQTLIAA